MEEAAGEAADATAEGRWYPHPTARQCVNDGLQREHFVQVSQVYISVDACCDAHYSFDADCVAKSMNPTKEGKWYPDGSTCISQSPVPGWIAHVFGSREDCCMDHFKYHFKDCIGDLDTAEATPRPTRQPQEPMPQAQAASTTPRPTPKPTERPKEPSEVGDQITVTIGETSPAKPQDYGGDLWVNEYAQEYHLFYPYYGDKGTSAECRNDGNVPRWMGSSMMKSSEHKCCQFYFFPEWEERCLSDHPFYPDFREKSCINDGKQPGHMAGDYLVDELWRCCHIFYQNDEELLSRCTNM